MGPLSSVVNTFSAIESGLAALEGKSPPGAIAVWSVAVSSGGGDFMLGIEPQ